MSTNLKGFQFAGINSGIKKNKLDLGLILSEKPAVLAGVTTKSKIYAAPVKYCRELIARKKARAILVNSGNANSYTGKNGYQDCLEVTTELAQIIAVPAEEIAFTSTGIIGVPLPKRIIIASFDTLKDSLSNDPASFAGSIMTTDLTMKLHEQSITTTAGITTITGIAKGSGMIAPNMATMLGFICMDIDIKAEEIQSILSEIVDETFNMVSVDGDTSTNDMVLAVANGASYVSYAALSVDERSAFMAALHDVCKELSKDIARDGEGATKMMEVTVIEAGSKDMARTVVHSVINSPLIKTAMYGADPNWGRFMMAVGKTGLDGISDEKTSLNIGPHLLVDRGIVLPFVREDVRSYLQQKEIKITIALGLGGFAATGWGCDLTEDYVKINTAYN